MKLFKMIFRNKKGEDIVISNFIFIVLNVIILIGFLFFVVRAGSTDGIYEQTYAKKIALLIDEAKSGTNIELNIEELVNRAQENRYREGIVEIEDNKIVVRVRSGQGYEFSFFSDVSITEKVDIENKKLFLEIK